MWILFIGIYNHLLLIQLYNKDRVRQRENEDHEVNEQIIRKNFIIYKEVRKKLKDSRTESY